MFVIENRKNTETPKKIRTADEKNTEKPENTEDFHPWVFKGTDNKWKGPPDKQKGPMDLKYLLLKNQFPRTRNPAYSN